MAFTREAIEEKVKASIIKIFNTKGGEGKDTKEIDIQAKFVDDLGADSLDQIDFIMDIEDEFDIEIPDEDVEKMTAVEDMVNYLMKKLNDAK